MIAIMSWAMLVSIGSEVAVSDVRRLFPTLMVVSPVRSVRGKVVSKLLSAYKLASFGVPESVRTDRQVWWNQGSSGYCIGKTKYFIVNKRVKSQLICTLWSCRRKSAARWGSGGVELVGLGILLQRPLENIDIWSRFEAGWPWWGGRTSARKSAWGNL